MQYRPLFFACCLALVGGCDDSTNDGGSAGTSGGARDASTDGSAARDGSSDDDDGDGESGASGHAHGGKGGTNAADHDAASGSGASGKGGGSGGSDDDDDSTDDDVAMDASTSDAGSDSGVDASEPDPADPCGDNVECAGGCCAAGQVCYATAQTFATIDFPNVNRATQTVVLGSTITFTWGSNHDHDVQLFPNASAFDNCSFGSAQLLTESSGYVWTASAFGDFYFGCSVSDHCDEDGMKLHVIVVGTDACQNP